MRTLIERFKWQGQLRDRKDPAFPIPCMGLKAHERSSVVHYHIGPADAHLICTESIEGFTDTEAHHVGKTFKVSHRHLRAQDIGNLKRLDTISLVLDP